MTGTSFRRSSAGGGHGVVYSAYDRDSGATVALKFLHDSVAIDPQYNIRMLREAQVMAALAGTSAIRVYGLRTTPEGALYLVMELLTGVDLDDHLTELEATGERLSVHRLFELLDPIVDTLEAAHARGIVHRDMKPANIFVLDSGGVRLLDFGLAKVLTASPLTNDGMIAGSPSYIAPEVWRGNPRMLDQSASTSIPSARYRFPRPSPEACRSAEERSSRSFTSRRPASDPVSSQSDRICRTRSTPGSSRPWPSSPTCAFTRCAGCGTPFARCSACPGPDAEPSARATS